MSERDYLEGARRVALDLLRVALDHLGESGRTKHAWVLERQEAVAMLRRFCAENGDNDWPDNLHLGDVIEKHVDWDREP